MLDPNSAHAAHHTLPNFLTGVVSGVNPACTSAQNTSAKKTSTHASTHIARSEDHIADIFTKFDLAHISPREIDEMTDALNAARFDDAGFILMLSTRGEGFRSHMQDVVDGVGFTRDSAFDPTKPNDIIEQAQSQLEFAQRYGDPTDFLADQVEKMVSIYQKYQSKNATDIAGPHTPPPLILIADQRIWIE